MRTPLSVTTSSSFLQLLFVKEPFQMDSIHRYNTIPDYIFLVEYFEFAVFQFIFKVFISYESILDILQNASIRLIQRYLVIEKEESNCMFPLRTYIQYI